VVRSRISPSAHSRRCIAALVSLAAAISLAVPAIAAALPQPTLFETTGGNGGQLEEPPASDLYKVDPATGATASVGNTGYAITGLAQDPTTGILYAVSNTRSPIAPLTLLQLDPATGAATPVGPLEGRVIADISFDSQGRLFGLAEGADDVASIDKQTGAVTLIVSPADISMGNGNSFDRDDNLWFMGGRGENSEYATIDTTTGAVTPRGQLIPIDENDSAVSAAAWDCARTTLYATLNNRGKPPANLVTIDVSTGAITNKGTTVTAADGLEWYCPLAFETTKKRATVAAGKARTLIVPLVRGPRIKGEASVSYATKSGSAQAGRDFKALSGTATFANNATEQSLALRVTPDPRAGKNRTFTLRLSKPSADGSVGKALTVTIKTAKPRLKLRGPRQTVAGPVFRLRSNEIPARFRCKIDGGRFKGCGKNGRKGKTLKIRGLDPGRHTLVVQTVNGAGLKSKPVKKKFAVLG
jgi:uncharacterized protein YjiK